MKGIQDEALATPMHGVILQMNTLSSDKDVMLSNGQTCSGTHIGVLAKIVLLCYCRSIEARVIGVWKVLRL